LEYAKIFQKELDQQIIEGATSGWMEDNAGQVKYTGGNEVKIPTISTCCNCIGQTAQRPSVRQWKHWTCW